MLRTAFSLSASPPFSRRSRNAAVVRRVLPPLRTAATHATKKPSVDDNCRPESSADAAVTETPANAANAGTSARTNAKKTFEAVFDERQREDLRAEWNHPECSPQELHSPEDLYREPQTLNP
jgi:hypothetical protein